MWVPSASLPLLLLLALTVTLPKLPAVTSKRVNLIHPEFIGARVDFCSSRSLCNFTLWTRAAEYKLVNFDAIDGKTGHFERVSDFKVVPVLEQTHFFAQNGTQMSYRDFVTKIESTRIQTFSTMMCTSRNRITARKPIDRLNSIFVNLELCIRDDIVLGRTEEKLPYRIDLDRLFPFSPEGNVTSNYAFPITASAAWSKPLQLMDWFLFDASGRMIYTQWEHRGDALPRPINRAKIWDLSSVTNPISELLELDDQWLQDSHLLNNMTELEDRLAKDLLVKMKASYVQTITPIFSKKDGANFGLCYNNGYYLGNDNPPIVCYSQGRPEALDRFEAIPGHKAFIYAFHLENHNGFRDMHLFYDLHFIERNRSAEHSKTTKRKYYLRCKIQGEFYSDEIPANRKLIILGDQQPEGCTSFERLDEKLLTAPNDVIGFHDGAKCSVLIAFHDLEYIVHQIDSDIKVNATRAMPLKNLNFFINAAFALGDQIYFFTHVNTLIQARGVMSDGCKTLTLDSLREIDGMEFVMNRALLRPGASVDRLPLLGYREFEEGASDTNPPTGMTITVTSNPIFPTPGTQKPPTKEQAKGSFNIVVAIIGVIVGVLVVAGIIYLLCLKEEKPTPTRLKSHPKSKRVATSSTLALPTVRSKQSDSGIVSKFLSKTPAPKSMKLPMMRKSNSPRVISVASPSSRQKSMKSMASKMSKSPKSSSPSSPKSSRTPRSPQSPSTSPQTKK